MPSDGDLSRRSYLKLAGGAGAAITLAGCSGQQDGEASPTGTEPMETTAPGDGGTPMDTDTATPTPLPDFAMTVTQGQMDSGLDPQDHAETPTDNIVRQAYEGVLDRNKKGGIVQGLATEWERIEPGRVEFTLRDATFHNGDPLTPEDIAYSIRRIVFEDVGFASPQSGDLGAVTEVQTGDSSVTVLFDGLNPIAFQLFATNGDIMQKSWVENNSRDFINQNTNGTGPFTATAYDSGNEVVFERFEDYWKGPAPVSELTFNSASETSTRVNRLLQGETDITVNVEPQFISQIQNSDSGRVAPVPSTRVIFLQMRYDVEPFSNVKFRQAMNYAVDVQSIIENVLSGFGNQVGQPTLPEFVGYNPDVEPYPHDPAEAERLVEESGFSGVEIELQTPIGRYLKDVEVAQAAANQMNSLSNVTCNLQQREFASLVQDLLTGKIEDKPNFTLLGWGNGEFDAAQTIGPLLTSSGALTILKNDEVDALIQEANNTADPEKRVDLLQEANALLHDLAPWVFLHQQFSVYGVSNRVNWKPRSDEAIDPYTATPR